MFNYEELAQIAGTWFADVIRDKIRKQEEIRAILHYETVQDEDVVTVNILTGWNGKPHSLWTYKYSPEWGNEISVDVVNAKQVVAFNRIITLVK